MSPENTVAERFVTLTVTDITVFPPGERWGRIPFVTTSSMIPVLHVLDLEHKII